MPSESFPLQVGGSESEAMVEVVDGWLAKLHPNKPTWREIADVVESIGHHNLAHSLRQVYISGREITRLNKLFTCEYIAITCEFIHGYIHNPTSPIKFHYSHVKFVQSS